MYAALVLGVAFWAAYGIAKHDWPLILSNAFILFFAGIVLVMKVKNDILPLWKAGRKE